MKSLSDILFDTETDLLLSLYKLLLKGSDKLSAIEWRNEKLIEIGGIKKLNKKIISNKFKQSIPIIEKELINKAKTASKMKGLVSLTVSDPKFQIIYNTYKTKVVDKMNELGASLMIKANRVAFDVVEEATFKAISGFTTLDKAIETTCKKWVDSGFKPIKDIKNREWSIEGYSSVVVRSNIRELVTEVTKATIESNDIDLVEISSHSGAREKCALYQGKVFSLSGKSTKYDSLDSTSYGEVDGLFGINCTHRMYPYIEGTDTTFKPVDKELNEKVYEDKQHQRKLERDIRSLKRDVDFYKINDKDKADIYNKKLHDKQDEIKKFTEDNELRRDYNREKIFTA